MVGIDDKLNAMGDQVPTARIFVRPIKGAVNSDTDLNDGEISDYW